MIALGLGLGMTLLQGSGANPLALLTESNEEIADETGTELETES